MVAASCTGAIDVGIIRRGPSPVRAMHHGVRTLSCRLGVLVEVNCETDFVARGDKFKELVSDLAMQVGLQHQAV